MKDDFARFAHPRNKHFRKVLAQQGRVQVDSDFNESLSLNQKRRIKELQRECFSTVRADEIRECFIAKSFGWVFAYAGVRIVGQVELYLREVSFAGRRISLGGLGGTCVTASYRNKGIGKELVKKGLEILKERGADIACLSADIKNYPHGIYRQLGFELMEREISFEDVYGMIRHDSGELFIPIWSKEIYDLVMKSDKIFHLGRGYWSLINGEANGSAVRES